MFLNMLWLEHQHGVNTLVCSLTPPFIGLAARLEMEGDGSLSCAVSMDSSNGPAIPTQTRSNTSARAQCHAHPLKTLASCSHIVIMPQIMPAEYSQDSENYQCQKVVGHATLCSISLEMQSVVLDDIYGFCLLGRAQ